MGSTATPKISRHGKACVNCARAKVKCVEKRGFTACERYVLISRDYFLISQCWPEWCFLRALGFNFGLFFWESWNETLSNIQPRHSRYSCIGKRRKGRRFAGLTPLSLKSHIVDICNRDSDAYQVLSTHERLSTNC